MKLFLSDHQAGAVVSACKEDAHIHQIPFTLHGEVSHLEFSSVDKMNFSEYTLLIRDYLLKSGDDDMS